MGVQVCFEGRKRVRFYSDEYQVSQCPLRHYRIRSWMVIDDANEADTELTYECQAQYTAANPVQHVQAAGVKHSLIPGETELVEMIDVELKILRDRY